MKKVHIFHFHKYYLFCVCMSLAIIIAGLVGYAIKGFNLGVDFQAGINQTVQLAYPVADLAYNGKGNVTLNISDKDAVFVFSGSDVENKTVQISFADRPTLGDFAQAVQAMPDMSITLRDQASTPTKLLVPSFQGSHALTAVPSVLHAAPADASRRFASTDKVRGAMKNFGSVSVQEVQPVSMQRYLIRVQDKGKDPNFSKTAPAQISAALEQAFGADRVVIMQTDYVGASYSQSLTKQAFILVALTILAILAYAAIRFKWQYAIGAVLAVIHDMLIMVTFVVWTRMEFNTSTIAAILTILGYSINDTIVQFDRVREDLKLRPHDKFSDVLDEALSETFGRTVITTVTTLIAVVALIVFTSGSLKDMSICLFVGLISGSYSTIFIASAFVLWWENVKAKRLALQSEAEKKAVSVPKKAQTVEQKKADKNSSAKRE